MFWIFYVVCKISNFNMWTAKHLAQASCTELTLKQTAMPLYLDSIFETVWNRIAVVKTFKFVSNLKKSKIIYVHRSMIWNKEEIKRKNEKAHKMLSNKMAGKEKRTKLSRKIYQDCRISRLVLKPKQSVKKLKHHNSHSFRLLEGQNPSNKVLQWAFFETEF